MYGILELKDLLSLIFSFFVAADRAHAQSRRSRPSLGRSYIHKRCNAADVLNVTKGLSTHVRFCVRFGVRFNARFPFKPYRDPILRQTQITTVYKHIS